MIKENNWTSVRDWWHFKICQKKSILKQIRATSRVKYRLNTYDDRRKKIDLSERQDVRPALLTMELECLNITQRWCQRCLRCTYFHSFHCGHCAKAADCFLLHLKPRKKNLQCIKRKLTQSLGCLLWSRVHFKLSYLVQIKSLVALKRAVTAI